MATIIFTKGVLLSIVGLNMPHEPVDVKTRNHVTSANLLLFNVLLMMSRVNHVNKDSSPRNTLQHIQICF